MRKSKINEESGSPDELEASPLESDQGSSDDADFDRPKIKPPDPEGPKKKSKSSKREKERKRKKSDDTSRNFLAPSRHDSKRDRHKRSESPPDKRLRNNQGWRAPNLYEAQRRNFRAYDGPSSREPKEMADRRGEDLRARKEKRRKHSRPEDTWRDGGNRGNNDGRYHSNETSGRDSNRKHSELSAGESSLVSKSDSFSTDKEAKEELKRIERRIAELKGTKIEDDDINENYKSSSSQDDSINSKRRSEVVKEEENAIKNMSGKEESLKAKATLIDAEVEDVSASESEKSSSVSIDRNETIETEHKLGDMPLERSATAASSSDSDSEMDEAIDRPRLLPAAYSSKFDNLEESFDATEVEVVRKQQVKKGAKPGSDLQSQTSSPAHRSQIADSKGDGVVAEAAMMQRIEEAKRPLLPVYYPALQGCRSVDEFKHLNRIEEGTYGVVYRAKDLRSSEIVALKRLKMEKEREGFPITSLREINCLLKSQHPNVVPVREIVVGSNMDKIYLVMDYVEHDLKALMETMKHPFLIGETKTIMLQLLEGVKHLHDNWILHRDLKASNLLFSHKGELKIGDFGLAREYGSPLKPYTPIVVTLWYRAPELLLGTKLYSKPIDMWSVGCIFGELLSQKPMFPGKSETEQLNLIFKELGTPNEKIWPDWPNLPMVKKIVFTEYPYNNLRKRFGTSLTESGIALMNRFLTYDPKRRITASEALKHEFFKETPKPVDPSQFPTWPAKSENAYGHKKSTESGKSPKAPEGGEAYNKLLANEDDTTIGFQLTNATVGLAKRGSGFTLKF